MNLNASLLLQVLCQLIVRAPYSNDADMVVSNLVSAISNQSPTPVQPATLPDGYIAYPEIGAAYKIVFDKVRWSEAKEKCNLDGAHLGILDSERKLEYVLFTTCHTYDCVENSDRANIHTGIYRMDEQWLDTNTGTTLSDLPWGGHYPKNSGADCALVEILPSLKSYLHNNHDCSSKHFYLCEISIPQNYKTQGN